MTHANILQVLWILACLLGVVWALASAAVLRSAPNSNVVAVINNEPIERQEFDRAIAAITADKRNPVTPEDRERVLQRLIEEELLIQRGHEIGLVDRDRNVRGAIVQSVIDHVLTPAQTEPISDDELKTWYDENIMRFASQPRLHLRPTKTDEAVIVPDGLVPISTLRDYVGGQVVEAALGAEPGQQLQIDGEPVFELIAKTEAEVPDFDAIKPDIETLLRRDAGDAAFRDYLAWLKQRAEIKKTP